MQPVIQPVIIIGLTLILIGAAYLAWWGPRWWKIRRIMRRLRQAAQTKPWSPKQKETVLEEARLLGVTDSLFVQLVHCLPQEASTDPRALALVERYLANCSPKAAEASLLRMWAYAIPHEPVTPDRLPHAVNVTTLLDRLQEMGAAKTEDYQQRARWAQRWVLVSPIGLNAIWEVWQMAPSEQPALLRLLSDGLAALWLQREEWPQTYRDLWMPRAAQIFTQATVQWPYDIETHFLSVEAAFAVDNARLCFEQAAHIRERFGAAAMRDSIWRLWGRAICAMESGNWPAYAQGHFSTLPPTTTWSRLLEVFEHASRVAPEDTDLLDGLGWTYLGAKVPLQRALPVYEHLLQRERPVAPAIFQLAKYYHSQRHWNQLQQACRLLIAIDVEDILQVYRLLAEALVEGNLADDKLVFTTVFDEDPAAYPRLNQRLARLYVTQEMTAEDYGRVERLLEAPFDDEGLRLALREKLALALLEMSPPPSSLARLVSSYLARGGTNLRIKEWAAANLEEDGESRSLKVAALEALIARRPVNIEDCYRLARYYADRPPDADKYQALADAAESAWVSHPSWSDEDLNLALQLYQHAHLTQPTQERLLYELVKSASPGMSENALRALDKLLTCSLEAGWATTELLEQVLAHRFAGTDPSPLHIWVLEKVTESEQGLLIYGLRLLALYDQGHGRPSVKAAQAREAGEALTARLVGWIAQNPRNAECPRLVHALYQRICQRPPDQLLEHQIALYLLAIEHGWLPEKADLEYAWALAEALVKSNDPRAIDVARWSYKHSKGAPEDAQALLRIASATGSLQVQDEYWFDIACKAWSDGLSGEIARTFLVEALKARLPWSAKETQTAIQLLSDPIAHDQLAATFLDRVRLGVDAKTDKLIIALVDEQPGRAEKDRHLLLATAAERARQGRVDDALDLYKRAEALAPLDEEACCEVLLLLPRTLQRSQYEGLIRTWLWRFNESFKIHDLLIPLVRDENCPLPFDLALKIVKKWADMAKGTGGVDASWIVTAKTDLYRHYAAKVGPNETRDILNSIMEHTREPLSQEARQQVMAICQSVLSLPQVDDEARMIVAEGLYGLGDLHGATLHLELLASRTDHKKTAVQYLEQIARQLESPLRDVPSLLIAYHQIAADAYEKGDLARAEEVLRKALHILASEEAFLDLTADQRRLAERHRDPLLQLYQYILEGRQETGALSLDDQTTLADIYRLRGLWDRAGRLYNRLAEDLKRRKDQARMLTFAEQVLQCYYRAGKFWWDIAAGQVLTLLTGDNRVPSRAEIDGFTADQLGLVEQIGILYHALYADRSLDLALDQRNRYRFNARQIYERLPFSYLEERPYLRELKDDLNRADSLIQDPLQHVERFRSLGGPAVGPNRRYELQDRLGGGEFADVYKVLDTQTQQIYAMKSLRRHDTQAEARFQREGRWLLDLHHPNIVQCFDVGVRSEGQYMLMEYVDGVTLDELMARRTNLPLDKRLAIFLDVCNAVAFVHDQGILHRDLHPGNILVGGDGEVVKLSDFGLATLMDREGIGKSSRIHGRENYTSPEVFEHKVETVTSDIFSLGAILCFLLTGTPRYDMPTLEMLRSERFFRLGEVVERAMRTRPEERYQSVTELIAAVRERVPGVAHSYGPLIQKMDERRFRQLFQLLEEIGRGESGVVYRAHDLRVSGAPDVAVKAVENQWVSQALERRAADFFRVRDLNHPNIVRLHAFFRTNEYLYVVMEWVDGLSLAKLMEDKAAAGGRFSSAEVLSLTADVAKALACIHEHGIVHGAVIPSNILIETASKRAKLSDFATAMLYDGDQWHRSAMLRPHAYYLAPEIEQGNNVTPSSDVYSLGWLLCQLATGRRGRQMPNDILAALYELDDLSEDQRDGIVALIEGSTRNNPGGRAYPDGAAFLAAMEKIGALGR